MIVAWKPMRYHKHTIRTKHAFDKLSAKLQISELEALNDSSIRIQSIRPAANKTGEYRLVIDESDNIVIYTKDRKLERVSSVHSQGTLHEYIEYGKYSLAFYGNKAIELLIDQIIVCQLPVSFWSYKATCGVVFVRHPILEKHELYVIDDRRQLCRCDMMMIAKTADMLDERCQTTDLVPHVHAIDNDVADFCYDHSMRQYYYLTNTGKVVSSRRSSTTKICDIKSSLDSIYENVPISIAKIDASIIVASNLTHKTEDNNKNSMILINRYGKKTDELITETSHNEYYMYCYIKTFSFKKCNFVVATRCLSFCDLIAVVGCKLEIIKQDISSCNTATFSIWDSLIEVDNNRVDMIFVGYEIFNRITISIK